MILHAVVAGNNKIHSAYPTEKEALIVKNALGESYKIIPYEVVKHVEKRFHIKYETTKSNPFKKEQGEFEGTQEGFEKLISVLLKSWNNVHECSRKEIK